MGSKRTTFKHINMGVSTPYLVSKIRGHVYSHYFSANFRQKKSVFVASFFVLHSGKAMTKNGHLRSINESLANSFSHQAPQIEFPGRRKPFKIDVHTQSVTFIYI